MINHNVTAGTFVFLDGGSGDDSLSTENLSPGSVSDRITTVFLENIDEAVDSTTIDDAFAELTELGAKL